jgi:serine/threonine-protein phosphatase 2A activator
MKFLCSIEDCINVEVYCNQSSRYGNKEFCVWHQKVEKLAEGLFDELLSPDLLPAKVELCPYLFSSFGDLVRLDYGTGHELAFCLLLLCCYKLDIFSSHDLSAIGGIIFPKYTSVVQKLLTTYRLEPAGSKGAWGLDDYFFLSFYWGSAQLINQNLFTPSCIIDKNIVEAHEKQYAYFACVAFIVKLKGLPISQTAPLLNDISHLHSWTKINDGLFKMYEGECLSKLPIMQHVLFGSLLRFEVL